MARPQVGRLDGNRRLEATVQPGDHFAFRANGGELEEISRALSNLSPTLQRMAESRIAEDQARGRTDATAIYAEIKETGQRIRSGEIAPHESKWYRAAAQEQIGRLVAASYGQDLILATQQDEELSQSTDPRDFDKFESQYRKTFLDGMLEGDPEKDQSFMSGFNASGAQAMLNARQSFTAQAAQRLDGQVLDNTYTELQLGIRDHIMSGASSEAIGQFMANRLNTLLVANPKLGKALNRTAREAIFDAARAYENPELLDIALKIPGGVPGSSLGLTRDFLSKRTDVEREIRSNRQQRLAAEERDEKRQRKQTVGQVYDGVVAALEQNPDVNLSEFAKQLLAVDPTEVPKLYRLAKAFRTQDAKDDPVVAGGLWTSLFDGELSDDAVMDAFTEGAIGLNTMKQLRSKLAAERKAGRTGSSKALIQDAYYDANLDNLRNMMSSLYGDQPAAAREEADRQFRLEWIQWRLGAGATASEQEKNAWGQDATDRIFRRFTKQLPEIRRRSTEQGVKADRPSAVVGRGPTLPDWTTEPVIVSPKGDSPFVAMDRFEREWNEFKAARARGVSVRLSPWAESFIITYDLTPDDIPLFIERQRSLRKQQQQQ